MISPILTLRTKLKDTISRCPLCHELCPAALGKLLNQFAMEEKDTFRLFIKPFMDSWTWDEDRIDRCCTHVIRPAGKLDSFCRYYHSGIS